MVYVFLSRLSEKSKSINRLISAIEADMADGDEWQHDFQLINQAGRSTFDAATTTIELATFMPCALSPSLLATLKWSDITSEYDLDVIREVISKIGKDSYGKKMIAEAIDNEACASYHNEEDLPFPTIDYPAIQRLCMSYDGEDNTKDLSCRITKENTVLIESPELHLHKTATKEIIENYGTIDTPDIVPALKLRINDLENELQAYKEQEKHIDAGQAAALFLAIAQMTEGNNGNNVNKQKLALAVSKIFGFKVSDDGTGYIRNLLCGTNGGITDKHKKKAADIVKEAMPNLSEKIKKI